MTREMNGGVKDLDSNAWWLNSSLPEPQHSFSKGTQICYPNPGAGISYLFSSLLKLADTPFICRVIAQRIPWLVTWQQYILYYPYEEILMNTSGDIHK